MTQQTDKKLPYGCKSMQAVENVRNYQKNYQRNYNNKYAASLRDEINLLRDLVKMYKYTTYILFAFLIIEFILLFAN